MVVDGEQRNHGHAFENVKQPENPMNRGKIIGGVKLFERDA
jgi:hypothetical protein